MLLLTSIRATAANAAGRFDTMNIVTAAMTGGRRVSEFQVGGVIPACSYFDTAVCKAFEMLTLMLMSKHPTVDIAVMNG